MHISLENTVNIREMAEAVIKFGADRSFLYTGEPGIGKTQSLFVDVKRAYPNMRTVYLDCANMMLGDGGIPTFVEVDGMTQMRFAPNELLGFGSKTPICLMLDEVTKATSDEVRNMLMPVMLEHRMFQYYMPEGSRVVGTGNLEHEGFGDRFNAFQLNRVTHAVVRKPTSEEWREDFAMPNGIAPELIAWAHQDGAVFDTYLNYPDGKNCPPMLFNPYRPLTDAFVSPRSLAHASTYINRRHEISRELLRKLLIGTLGRSGTEAFMLYLDLADKLPTPEAQVANPTRVPISDDPMIHILLAMNAASRADAKTIDAYCKLMDRVSGELQSIFYKSIYSRDVNLFRMNKACKDWAAENYWVL